MTLTDPGVSETPIRSLTGPSGARMSLTEHKVDYTDAELAELNDEFERLPASKIIQWAVDNFGHHLAMSLREAAAIVHNLASVLATRRDRAS